MAEKVLVLGAGFGGLNTALKLARKDFDVTLVDRRSSHEYTPGIINIFRGRVPEKRLRLDLEEFLSGTGVEFHQAEVSMFEFEASRVELEDGSLEYDYLVIALGGEPATFGLNISEAYTPYSLKDVVELDEDLEGNDSIAIVGSGYVGIEVGSELAEKGHDVTILDRATRPMPNSPEKASHAALEYFEESGIDFRGGQEVVKVSPGTVETADGQDIEVDKIVWAAGVKPVEVVLEEFESGVDINSGLCSKSYDNVFALGDCTDSQWLKTAHNALEQASTVAENIDRKAALQEYSHGKNPLVVSMGDTGMFIYGDKVWKNRLIRKFKDLVRIRYWMVLKKEKLLTRFT